MQYLKIKTKYFGIIILVLLGTVLLASGAEALTVFSTQEKPDVNITIDGVKPYPGDPISSTPSFAITATTSNSVVSGRIRIAALQSALTFSQSGNIYTAAYTVTSPLSDGRRAVTIEVTDNYSNTRTFEVQPLYVQSADKVAIEGFALSYPNPFDPGLQPAAIGYTLSKPAEIKLNIFDLGGNLIKAQSYSADSNGGRAGYNEVTWDGKGSAGNYVGNGIYIFLLTGDGGVLQNGRGKITVFKR